MRRRGFVLFVLGLMAVLASAANPAHAQKHPPAVDTTPGKPPSDAIVLFDGHSTEHFLSTKGGPCQWPVVDGAMEVRDGFIVSKLHFRDAQIHVEFRTPDDGKTGEATGNSGVYIFGQYEMQILNSGGSSVEPKNLVGALYRISPPLVDAGRRPGQWQAYDIIYNAPRRDASGKVIKPGSITALLNGVLVQHDAHFTESVSVWHPLIYKTTPYTDKILASIRKTGCGPLFLQDHGSPVHFRNIWLRPLDDKAKPFATP